MTLLDQLISTAYASQGKQEDVNKVYLALLHANLFLPIKKNHGVDDEEPFRPLYAKIEQQYFMMAFDTLERLQTWAGDQLQEMHYVEISGRDFIAGIHESVFFVLNGGGEFAKEFSPDEVRQLKKIVGRIEQLKLPA